eukprot:GEMP01156818.1.p1 GENE.GEMP01156818.1~~GEMP01156818.1.p1  ORF type:complete len:118 (+),score=10.03 GEMP01156818.1:22-354(+)
MVAAHRLSCLPPPLLVQTRRIVFAVFVRFFICAFLFALFLPTACNRGLLKVFRILSKSGRPAAVVSKFLLGSRGLHVEVRQCTFCDCSNTAYFAAIRAGVFPRPLKRDFL